jgi:hypothetical protein
MLIQRRIDFFAGQAQWLEPRASRIGATVQARFAKRSDASADADDSRFESAAW